jgi:hypothetical protein
MSAGKSEPNQLWYQSAEGKLRRAQGKVTRRKRVRIVVVKQLGCFKRFTNESKISKRAMSLQRDGPIEAISEQV